MKYVILLHAYFHVFLGNIFGSSPQYFKNYAVLCRALHIYQGRLYTVRDYTIIERLAYHSIHNYTF